MKEGEHISMGRIRIGILGYDGVAAINVAGPLEAFSNAYRADPSGQWERGYEVVLVAARASQFVTDSGVTFQAECSEAGDRFDTIIVPGGQGMRRPEIVLEVANWIKAHAKETRRIASVCTGVYGLASTGLLDGRRVTTHWQHALDVMTHFPNLTVEESALVLKDDKFYTAAGATAGIDLALLLIAEDYGNETAVTVARRLLVYVQRSGGQEQYSEPARPDVHFGPETRELNTNRLGKLVQWIHRHLGDDLKLDRLAKQAMLSKADFVRQFIEAFGIPPGLFVKNLRFNEARRRLLLGENAIEVAQAVGFADSAYFIQEFRRRFGVLPTDYQLHFQCANGRHEPDAGRAALVRPNRNGSRSNPRTRPRITSFTRCARRHTCVDVIDEN